MGYQHRLRLLSGRAGLLVMCFTLSLASGTGVRSLFGLDTDLDLLPDDWEMASFGNLSASPLGDPDHDGIDNYGEYLRGSGPLEGALPGGSFLAPVTLSTGTTPTALGIGDFNNDGAVDIAVSSADDDKVYVHLGNGDGTFQAPTGYACTLPYYSSVAVGDFNSDGNQDIAVPSGSFPSRAAVLLGNGDGTFQAAVTFATGTGPGAGPAGMLAGEFDGDGIQDLAITCYGDDTISIHTGAGDGTFSGPASIPTAAGPFGIAGGDFNGDDIEDLAIGAEGSDVLVIHAGNGDGTFQAGVAYDTSAYPNHVAVGDFDGDGFPDAALSCWGVPKLVIHLNNGDGTFADAVQYASGTSPWGVSAGDFNGDGLIDAAVSAFTSQTLNIHHGNGDGAFQPPVAHDAGLTPGEIAVADFDNDGVQDVAMVLTENGLVQIFLGLKFPRLTVESSPTADINITGTAPGVTPYEVTTDFDESVSLVAPDEASVAGTHYEFLRWRVDGVDQPDGVVSVQVVMDTAHTVTALYETALHLRVTGIAWSENSTTARVSFEANEPVQRYYCRLYQTQSTYSGTTSPDMTYTGLGEGYYLVIVTARDTNGDFAPEPCRVWFFNKPVGIEYQVYLASYVIDHDAITFTLASNEATSRYYVRLYGLESAYTAVPTGLQIYNGLADGLYYFVATGKEAASGNFPGVPPGPARQFFYINTAGF